MNILITGGASGLGKAITTLLVKDPGNMVYFTYCNAVEAAAEMGDTFPNTSGLPCDFKSQASMNTFIKRLHEIDLDVLINNAYSGEVEPVHFHKIPSEAFVDDFSQNVLPVVQITQEVIKIFRKKKQGKIITVLTSYLANVPPMGLSRYVAGKAYLEKLTKIWAAENVKFGITSNSVSPSFMRSNLTANVDERMVEQMIHEHPLKRLITAEEVAETVLFLVNASSHINGVDILMNAGVNLKS